MHRPAERSIAVVIPSRLAAGAGRRFFVERAIEAAVTQAIPRGFRLAFFIGIDLDAQIPSALGARPDVTFARSHGRSQASAINAAANAAAVQNHDFIALLEDDDQWEPNFLAWALPCLESCDFVSSNQLEVDAEERCVRVNDFPTPSGWIMAADLWRKVGPFDESLRWHVDNDWLGRLALSGAQRIHLVEATAPINLQSCARGSSLDRQCSDAGRPVQLRAAASLFPAFGAPHSASGLRHASNRNQPDGGGGKPGRVSTTDRPLWANSLVAPSRGYGA